MAGFQRTFISLCMCVPFTLLLCGCFHPGFCNGRPYGQPVYAPPQSLNYGQPGSLTIPESSGPAYVPGGESTYDQDPDKDDFGRSGDDDVPLPNDRRTPFYGDEDDDLGPNTRLDKPTNTVAARPVSRTVSSTGIPMEYGFDTAEYRWLRGQLRYDPASRSWIVIYSSETRDRYAGSLRLEVSPEQISGLQDGDPVDVRGHVHAEAFAGKEAVYHVTDIRLMATRVAG